MMVTNTNIFGTAIIVVGQSVPDGISITHNGRIPWHENQWSGASMPLVLMPTASGVPLLDRAPTSVSASILDLPVDAGSDITINPVTADPCFKTLGYMLGSVSCYLPSSSGTDYTDECGIEYVRPEHRSVYLTLSADMVVDDILVSDTAEFTLHAFDRPAYFRRYNESFDMFSEFRRWDYLDGVGEGVLGEGVDGNVSLGDVLLAFVGDGSDPDGVGTRMYEKIANFSDNTSNVDRAEISALYSIAEKLSHPMDDFGIPYPIELLDLMNIASIPMSELFGVEDCWHLTIGEPACGDIDHTNLGDPLDVATHIVSAGEMLFFQLPTETRYQLHHVVPDSDDNQSYPLSAMVGGAIIEGVGQYCFFEYLSGGTGDRVGNYIDFDSPYTSLDSETTPETWNGDGGLLDTLFEHRLREGLGI